MLDRLVQYLIYRFFHRYHPDLLKCNVYYVRANRSLRRQFKISDSRLRVHDEWTHQYLIGLRLKGSDTIGPLYIWEFHRIARHFRDQKHA